MALLHIEIKDEDIKELGEEFTKDFIKKQIKLLRLKNLMDKIRRKISDSKIDYEKEVIKIREESWQEYKKEFLKE